MSSAHDAAETLAERLIQELGSGAISRDAGILDLFATDIWSRGERPAFVASPRTLEELQYTVKAAHDAGVPLNPRGGGMSYTGGYTADRPGVGILDFRRMDRIVEINEADMYVTVEAGCTWKTLYEALRPKRLRTPFFGPLSGISSTVGGGASQNNAFFGASLHGPASDSIAAMTVVLADGTLLRTGTAGTRGARPFSRHYGPDLTGLFIGDAGALGHKAEITLRLIPFPEADDYASFEFASRDTCAAAMAEAGREGIAAELFGFDPALTAVRMKRASLAEDARTLGSVIAGQGNILRGLREGAKMATAGRSFIGSGTWSLHMTVEGRSAASVAAGLDRLRSICEAHGGKEVANTIPKVIRANPFTPLNNMLGPEGERWVPIHGIVPMGEGPQTWCEIDETLDAMRADLDENGITTGFLVTTLSNSGYLIEPVFLWPDERYSVHDASVETETLKRARDFPPNPTARGVVERAREAVLAVFERHGAAHFQIGRTYPFMDLREDGTRKFLERIKEASDPHGLVNPGALGLRPPDAEIAVRNPRSGQIDFRFEAASASAIAAVAARQHEAGDAWRAQSLTDRAGRLGDLARALEARREEISAALEADTGRRRIARLELDGVIASITAWGAQAPGLTPDVNWTEGRQNPAIRHKAQMVPYGTVGVISPWNFPLTLSMIDTLPALLAGSTVIIKPSEVTPRFVAPMREAIRDAGLADVLAFVQGGASTGAALIEHVDAICFTGSVATGRKVAGAAAARMIPAFLELGGKDPLIVTASADLDRATDAALRGSVLSTGQACQSIERIYVHHSVHDRFVDILVTKAEKVRLNWPDIETGEIGPLIFARQAEVIRAQILDAVARGAKVLTGGTVEDHGGLWLRPTVLVDVNHAMAVMREETFGPVMPVMAYADEDEAVRLANDTDYGLSAAVMAGSLEEAEAIACRLEAGAISMNDAALTSLFHEAEKQSFKLSGLGPSRMGRAGFERFLRKKALIAQTGAPAPVGAFAEDG